MDPVEASSRWHRWAVAGSRSEIARLFAALDANLPAGWRRLAGEDLLPYQTLVREGSGWYAVDSTARHGGATLSLELFKGTELRGGRVWFAGPPDPTTSANLPAAWDQVIRLLDDGIVPAARAAGAQFRMPTPAEIFLSELPSGVRDRLRGFSDAARKSLPLDRAEAELWREFVVAAFRAQTVIDARSFRNWLVANGWSPVTADELNLRFTDQCLLLARFADEVSAA
jgi:hypothetical protein